MATISISIQSHLTTKEIFLRRVIFFVCESRISHHKTLCTGFWPALITGWTKHVRCPMLVAGYGVRGLREQSHTIYTWWSAMWPLQGQRSYTHALFLFPDLIYTTLQCIWISYLIRRQPCRSVIHFNPGTGWSTLPGKGNITSTPLL